MGAPTPSVIVTPFGTNAVGITNPVPVPSQLPGNPGYASFDDGFPTDTTGPSGLPPRWEDVQGILYMVTAYLQALTGGQNWVYNSTWAAANSGYALGAIVAMANGAGFWINNSAGNSNNPDTSAANTSGWAPLVAYGKTSVSTTGSSTTLTAVQAAMPTIIVSGTLTSNAQIFFPTWLKAWRVINNTAGAFTLSCAPTGGGTGVLIPQLTNIPVEITADGSGNIQYGGQTNIGSFTGTLTDGTNSTSLALGYVEANGFVSIFNNGITTSITSATAQLTITGIPAGLQSSVAPMIPVIGLTDNSSSASTPLAGVALMVNGQIRFGLNKTNLVTNDVAAQVWNFTTSGTKGVVAGFCMTYPLN